MARRPGTNDYYFMNGGAYPQVVALTGPVPGRVLADALPPWLMSAYTIQNGVATTIFMNQPTASSAECAAFIGNNLYWWTAGYVLDGFGNVLGGGQLRTFTLYRWDVTTAYAPVVVGTIANLRQIGGMVAVGTKLYWTENGAVDGRIAWWDTTLVFSTTTLAQPYGVSFPGFFPPAPFQIVHDGAGYLWGSGQQPAGLGFGSPSFTAPLYRVKIADGTFTLMGQPTDAAGAVTVQGGLAYFLTVSPYGYLSVFTWDGTNGGAPSWKYLVGTMPSGFSGPVRTVPGRALIISPFTMYGKFLMAAWANGNDSYFNQPPTGAGVNSEQLAFTTVANFTLFQYADPTVAVQDTVDTGQVLAASENLSYELGGANAVVSAVDATVTTRAASTGQPLYTEAGFGNPYPHILVMDQSCDPLSISSFGFIGLIRHARFPTVRSNGAGASLAGTIQVEAEAGIRIQLPFAPSLDPNLLNAVSIESKYFGSPPSATNAALRVLGESSQALHWPKIDTPAFPEVELNDVLTLTILQRTNIVTQSITGNFRVTAVNHTMSVAEGSAEARTNLELVSVP
jgi:hypothetical protein